MSDIPVRRGQVITPFGPGAISVSHKGDSMIMGVLDKWYYRGNEKSNGWKEFQIFEPRLAKVLDVDYFMLPPDFRISKEDENSNLILPMLRFPQWHYCSRCKKLKEFKTVETKLKRCECGGEYVQVPFVVICQHGHIDDFPWRKWVHKDNSGKSKCNKDMKLVAVGGTNLSTMEVRCDCGAKRSLFGTTSKSEGVDENNSDMTYLARNLDDTPEVFYRCTGRKAWFGGEDDKEPCSEYPLAVLKNSSNIYFPQTISAIYLPGNMPREVEEIIGLFETEIGKVYIKAALEWDIKKKQIEMLRNLFNSRIQGFSDENIGMAITYWNNTDGKLEGLSYTEDIEIQLRLEEYKALINEVDSKDLKIINEWTNRGDETDIVRFLNKVNLVTKLRETKVLYGFSRLNAPQVDFSIHKVKKGKAMLFKNPSVPENNWLPANITYGEGIFIEIDNDLLDEWEENNLKMQKRFQKLKERYSNLVDQKVVKSREITPRFVLIHTLAHLIINELVFECGYSAAAIRERLYVFDKDGVKTNGVLIYTSSGDTDGTMGGLVRMGKLDNLIPILEKAINKAKWCSSDPICTDIGEMSGQGVQQLNMSACHNCTYLPETSCEEFNMLLDRGVVVGTPSNPEIGFFNR